MTKRTSQQHPSVAALLDEPIIEKLAPEIQVNETAIEENEVDESVSTSNRGRNSSSRSWLGTRSLRRICRR